MPAQHWWHSSGVRFEISRPIVSLMFTELFLFYILGQTESKMKSRTVWAATDYNICEQIQTGGFRKWVSDHEKGDSFQEKQLPFHFVSNQSIVLPLDLYHTSIIAHSSSDCLNCFSFPSWIGLSVETPLHYLITTAISFETWCCFWVRSSSFSGLLGRVAEANTHVRSHWTSSRTPASAPGQLLAGRPSSAGHQPHSCAPPGPDNVTPWKFLLNQHFLFTAAECDSQMYFLYSPFEKLFYAATSKAFKGF